MKNSPDLTAVKAVFLDMDGTIYHGSKLYPTTLPFLKFLQKHHIKWNYAPITPPAVKVNM